MGIQRAIEEAGSQRGSQAKVVGSRAHKPPRRKAAAPSLRHAHCGYPANFPFHSWYCAGVLLGISNTLACVIRLIHAWTCRMKTRRWRRVDTLGHHRLGLLATPPSERLSCRRLRERRGVRSRGLSLSLAVARSRLGPRDRSGFPAGPGCRGRLESPSSQIWNFSHLRPGARKRGGGQLPEREPCSPEACETRLTTSSAQPRCVLPKRRVSHINLSLPK